VCRERERERERESERERECSIPHGEKSGADEGDMALV